MYLQKNLKFDEQYRKNLIVEIDALLEYVVKNWSMLLSNQLILINSYSFQ